jgi:hypothetical protein
VVENNANPDCENVGGYDIVVYCSVCGDEVSRVHTEVPALGHNYNAVVTAPDCENGGYTTYTCTVCGDSYIADATDAGSGAITLFADIKVGALDIDATAEGEIFAQEQAEKAEKKAEAARKKAEKIAKATAAREAKAQAKA